MQSVFLLLMKFKKKNYLNFLKHKIKEKESNLLKQNSKTISLESLKATELISPLSNSN